MFQLYQKIKITVYSLMIIGFILILYQWIQLLNDKNLKIFEKEFWTSFYINSIFFICISMGSLLFLSIQNIAKSGWSIVIHSIMEKISSFIPYGSIMILIIIISSLIKINNIFQWMNIDFYHSFNDPELIKNKKFFLNIPFFLIRNLIYLLGCNIFYFRIKNISNKLTLIYSRSIYKKLYTNSILFIIFFSIISILMSWDWIMMLNVNWISTLFGWYFLSSFLISSISLITIISIFLKKNKFFEFFNKSHLHDLSTYLFSGSLLWSYFWFSQYILYWYGNITEEISYFIKREEIFYNIHFWILIPNFLVPFFLLRSKNKSNSKLVFTISMIILIGHYLDFYNLIYPELNKKFQFNWMINLGFLLLIGGLFIFILFFNLKNKKIYMYGNPFFQESKNYKNPYL